MGKPSQKKFENEDYEEETPRAAHTKVRCTREGCDYLYALNSESAITKYNEEGCPRSFGRCKKCRFQTLHWTKIPADKKIACQCMTCDKFYWMLVDHSQFRRAAQKLDNEGSTPRIGACPECDEKAAKNQFTRFFSAEENKWALHYAESFAFRAAKPPKVIKRRKEQDSEESDDSDQGASLSDQDFPPMDPDRVPQTWRRKPNFKTAPQVPEDDMMDFSDSLAASQNSHTPVPQKKIEKPVAEPSTNHLVNQAHWMAEMSNSDIGSWANAQPMMTPNNILRPQRAIYHQPLTATWVRSSQALGPNAIRTEDGMYLTPLSVINTC